MKKPILCRLGLHKPDKYRYMIVERRHWPGGKKYRRNYRICERCGKLIGTIKRVQVKK